MSDQQHLHPDADQDSPKKFNRAEKKAERHRERIQGFSF